MPARGVIYHPRRMGKSLALARAQAEAAATGQPMPVQAQKVQGHAEDDEQKTLFQSWVPLYLARFPALKLLHAIPNGGMRVQKVNKHGKRYSPEAQRMREQGVKAGVPDLDYPVPRITPGYMVEMEYAGLRIEMKSRWEKGKPGARKPETRPDQKEWLSDLQDAGHCCCLCYGWEQAAESILAYLTGQPVPHQWSRA